MTQAEIDAQIAQLNRDMRAGRGEPGVREGGRDPGRDQAAARAEPGRGRRLRSLVGRRSPRRVSPLRSAVRGTPRPAATVV